MIKLDREFFGRELNQAADSLIPSAISALGTIKDKTCKGGEYTGWFDWPATRGRALATDIKSWAKELKVEYDLIVVIGIGGS